MVGIYVGWLLIGTGWQPVCAGPTAEEAMALLLATARAAGLGNVLRVLPAGHQPEARCTNVVTKFRAQKILP
jgi:hypothetical protein